MSFLVSFKGYMKLKKHLPADIVFYSETKAYFVNFKVIIRELTDKKQKVIYVTSSKDDPVMNMETEYFIPVYIESTFFLLMFFNYLHAKILVTTLPDIDTFHLKRSKFVKNMIYVHHSLVSMNMIYLPKAFESYDTIFCTGLYHEAESREMEKEYGTKPKTLIKAGYPALDDFLERYEEYSKTHKGNTGNKLTVTIAPSWQPDNIIDVCIFNLIDILLEKGYIVKLRPHPRTLQLEKYKIDKILEKYKYNENFTVDNTPGNFASYMETDIMITDWSGTVYKYAFSTFKPIIFINTPIKVRNENYKNYENIPIEIKWRNILGSQVEPENIKEIPDMIEKLTADTEFADNLLKFRNDNVYNIGASGKVCADYIITCLNKL